MASRNELNHDTPSVNNNTSGSTNSTSSNGIFDNNTKNLLICANLARYKKLNLTKYKKINLVKSKKPNLADFKKSDFVKINFFGTDFLTLKTKKTFRHLQKAFIKTLIV